MYDLPQSTNQPSHASGLIGGLVGAFAFAMGVLGLGRRRHASDPAYRAQVDAGRAETVLTDEDAEVIRKAMDPSSPFGKRKRHTPHA